MADSAKAIIEGTLARYGLESLAGWAWDQYLAGASVEEIFLEMRDRDEYKRRFAAMEQLAQMGEAITEQAYIEYEATVKGLLQRWGITPGLYDTPEGIADLLVNRVSAAEVNDRLQRAAVATLSAPQEVKDALSSMGYDLSSGQLASFYLDPDRSLPLIEQEFRIAQVKGAATQQTVTLSLEEATRLAEQGISWEQAQQGFATVHATRALSGGAGETADEAERIRATFGDQSALEQVQRVQASRKSRFSGAGSAAETQEGVVGLGGAST